MIIKRYERQQRVIIPNDYAVDTMTYKITICLSKPSQQSLYKLDIYTSIENSLTIKMIDENIGVYTSEEVGIIHFNNVVENYKRKIKEIIN